MYLLPDANASSSVEVGAGKFAEHWTEIKATRLGVVLGTLEVERLSAGHNSTPMGETKRPKKKNYQSMSTSRQAPIGNQSSCLRLLLQGTHNLTCTLSAGLDFDRTSG